MRLSEKATRYALRLTASDRPALLVIVAGDYDSAKLKGVLHLFSEYDEQGFFGKVILVSPYLRRDRRIVLDDRTELYEFGWGWRNLRKLAAPVHLYRVIRECRRIVRRQGIHVIRATEPTTCGFIAWATSRLSGVPYCLSLHANYDALFALDGRRGAPTFVGTRRLVRPLEKLTLRGAALVLPIRQSLVPYALKRGVNPLNIRLIPHGVDLALFKSECAIDLRSSLDLPPDRKVVAFAGRLSPENYVLDMLEAVAAVAEQRDDFVFVMAGGGVLEAEIRARIDANPALRRVARLTGFISREMVIALRRHCAVSICLMGGFSLIEACAAGRPVIAYDVDWHGELVIDGVTGRLVAEHSITSVAAALTELLSDDLKASQMGRKAQALAFSRHDLTVTSRNKQRWYRELVPS